MFGWITKYFNKKTVVYQPDDSECLRFVKSYCSKNNPTSFLRSSPDYCSIWFKDLWMMIYFNNVYSSIQTKSISHTIYKLDKISQDYVLNLYKDRIPGYQDSVQTLKDKYLRQDQE